jgi:uncharacterized protein YjbI with pentapeptide repeats
VFSFTPCAAGCGRTAISGSTLCALHSLEPAEESRRLATEIEGRERSSDLSISHLVFENMNATGKILTGINGFQTTFRNCDFSGAYIRTCFFDFAAFTGCKFRDCDMLFMSFAGAAFTDCDFTNSELCHANFGGCIISNSVFNQSDLFNSRFIDARIKKGSFEDCNLKHCYFIDAVLDDCTFKASNTAEAVFTWEDNL